MLILFAICFGFGHDDTTVKPKASRNQAILPPSVRRSGLAEQLAPLGFHHKDGILSIGMTKMTERQRTCHVALLLGSMYIWSLLMLVPVTCVNQIFRNFA